MSECSLSVDKGLEKAEALGCDVVRGAPDLLLLDFDDVGSFERFDAMREMFVQFFKPESFETWYSKSGAPKRHVAIRLTKPLGVPERIALQAILGSDPKRELIGLIRYLSGQEEPSLLFKPRRMP